MFIQFLILHFKLYHIVGREPCYLAVNIVSLIILLLSLLSLLFLNTNTLKALDNTKQSLYGLFPQVCLVTCYIFP